VRPLIAVTTRLATRDQAGGRADALVVSRRYLDAVRRAGGQEAAVLERPVTAAEADELVQQFDGLVLIGGADVDPAQYGAEQHAETTTAPADVDAFDIALARAAIRNGIPTLAICRGLQVLNVAMGGTLIQHIPDVADRDEHRDGVMHEVDLKPASKVADAMGTERPMCSSFHHQAIDRLAPGLVETGWADDGTIEAVEVEGEPWIVAVQWHPEDTAGADHHQQALFDELVKRSGRCR
jgi:putative glutamine amidotransferase